MRIKKVEKKKKRVDVKRLLLFIALGVVSVAFVVGVAVVISVYTGDCKGCDKKDKPASTQEESITDEDDGVWTPNY